MSETSGGAAAPLDLDAIEQRAEWRARHGAGDGNADVAALVAEVRRLRAGCIVTLDDGRRYRLSANVKGGHVAVNMEREP